MRSAYASGHWEDPTPFHNSIKLEPLSRIISTRGLQLHKRCSWFRYSGKRIRTEEGREVTARALEPPLQEWVCVVFLDRRRRRAPTAKRSASTTWFAPKREMNAPPSVPPILDRVFGNHRPRNGPTVYKRPDNPESGPGLGMNPHFRIR